MGIYTEVHVSAKYNVYIGPEQKAAAFLRKFQRQYLDIYTYICSTTYEPFYSTNFCHVWGTFMIPSTAVIVFTDFQGKMKLHTQSLPIEK